MANSINVEVTGQALGKKDTTTIFTGDLAYTSDTPAAMYHEDYLELPTGTADQVIPLGSITTVRHLIVTSDQPVQLKVNGGTTVGAMGRKIIMVDCALTDLKISNNSGNLAKATVFMAGD